MLAEIAPARRLPASFTRSATRSAPVLWCEVGVRAGQAAAGRFAIVVNSGNSNAFTGSAGRAGVETTVAAAAEALACPRPRVRRLYRRDRRAAAGRTDRRKAARSARRARATAAEAAARAIMTTDTFPKGAARAAVLDGVPVSIAGFAKGSGMIAPDMATMLVFLFTDAAMDRGCCRRWSPRRTRTFNCITVDGDTSTSDTLLMAATGRAAMRRSVAGRSGRLRRMPSAG